MITIYKALSNMFNKPGISRANLLRYSKDHLRRLKANNTSGIYTLIIAYLTIVINTFEAEMKLIDSTKNLRKGQTKSVDQMTVIYTNTMSDYENEIASKLGGKKSPSFFEFYPDGQSEYSKPSRQDMDVFIPRIKIATDKHHTTLGVDISTVLYALETDYNAAREAQSESITDEKVNITVITINQLKLANKLNKSFHEIAAMHDEDIAPCIGLFNLNLLNSIVYHSHLVFSDSIAVSETALIINKLYADNFTFEIENTGETASIWIWIGETATDTDDSMAIEIKPGKYETLKPSDIGDLKKTFVLIKNDSSVNVASYKLTIIG